MINMERRVYLIIMIMGTLLTLIYLDDPDYISEKMPEITKAQNLVFVLMWAVFFWEIVPEWIERVKVVKFKEIVSVACMATGIAIILILFPEVQGEPYSVQRLINTGSAIAVLFAMYAVAYWYGKRREHNKGEEGEDLLIQNGHQN